MNLLRFLRKCINDRPAAIRSAKLVVRSFYGQWYWFRNPQAPLAYRIPDGGILLLEPGHSFTGCFWPGGVDFYEPEVRAFLLYVLKPGYTFIDCGANVGFFSVQAGGKVGRDGKIVSIEANPITYKLLERNLEANKIGIPLNCALTSQIGEVELFMPSDGDIYSSLRKDGLVENSASFHTFKIRGGTLDNVITELALSRVDVVKVDIEGAELDVLRSAPNLLSTFRPILVVEYGTNTWPCFGATPDGLETLADTYNYALRLFNPQKKELVSIPEEFWNTPYSNLILVPEERIQGSTLVTFDD